MEKVLDVCDDIDTLVTGNELFKARTVGVGIIPGDKAVEYGLSGPNLRAPASPTTSARSSPTSRTTEVEFDVVSAEGGDCYDRYLVRLERDPRSGQDRPPGRGQDPRRARWWPKVPRVIKVPKGQTYVRGENPKGEFGYYVISEGGQKPYRMKIRSTSFSNLSILPWILKGQLIPDLVAIMGSLDFVLGDVDR